MVRRDWAIFISENGIDAPDDFITHGICQLRPNALVVRHRGAHYSASGIAWSRPLRYTFVKEYGDKRSLRRRIFGLSMASRVYLSSTATSA